MSLLADITVQRGAFELQAKFDLPMQGVTVVFGPSGAGKSMLLSAIAGLAKLNAGRVSLNGEMLEDAPNKVRMPTHLRGIGLAFQEARLFPHLTVRGNLGYALSRAPEGPAVSLERTAERCDISELLERPVRNLSGGEKSRVALARALLSRPRLLLLDEPFAALDGPRRRAFLRLIMDASHELELPMMVVTHQIDDAAELADRMLLLRGGRLVAEGDAEDVMNGASLRGMLDVRDIGARVPLWMLSGVKHGRARAIWVRADHVVLANEEPRGLSARNVWAGEVADLIKEADGSVLASLKLGKGYILSRITPEAAAELKLVLGARAWAIVKAHSL